MNSSLLIDTGQLRIGMYVQPGVGWMHHAFNDRYGIVVSVNSTRPLRPEVSRDALDYLSPRQRICYFFERAVDPGPDEVHA